VATTDAGSVVERLIANNKTLVKSELLRFLRNHIIGNRSAA